MEAQTRILLVDDEPGVTKPLGEFLQREGYRVAVALNGQDALEQLPVFHPHLIVLDILMPWMDGREFLRRLRADGSGVPVLMLTEVTGADAHVQAFHEGADDYLDKPFSTGELIARTKAILRWTRPERPAGQSGRWLCCGQLRVDSQAQRVFLGKRVVKLPPREVRMLEHLMRHAGELVEHDALVEVQP